MTMGRTTLFLLVLTAIFLPLPKTHGENLNNNACSRIEDYYRLYTSKNCHYNPDFMSSTPSMIIRNGYKFESHKVVTEDGYILTLFRIPAKNVDQPKARQPIFLQHGLMGSSSNFVLIGKASPAFFLHELGYDVWLGNFRGTTYSQGHLTLSKTQKEFWNYVIDSNALYDLRSTLGFVANFTGHKIIYMGHSMGTTSIFMYCSTFPRECEDLIQGIIALCPVVYVDPGLFYKILFRIDPSLYYMATTPLIVLTANPEALHNLTQYFCRALPNTCRFLTDVILGISNQFPTELLLVLASHFPDPFSLTQFLQYGQIYNAQVLQRFDYGPEGNIKTYSQNHPPLYDLGRIKLPTFLFHGKRDSWISLQSVTRLYKELGSTRKLLRVVPENNDTYSFNHGDFISSKYISEFFYPELTMVLENEFTTSEIGQH